MFDPVNPLEKSLVEAAAHPEHRPQFLCDLLDSDVFTINREYAAPVTGGDTPLRVPLLTYENIVAAPIFSAQQRLEQFLEPGDHVMKVKGRDFFTWTRGAHVILNANSDMGKVFLPHEIERIMDGTFLMKDARKMTEKGRALLVGHAVLLPKELIKQLTALFTRIRDVRTAHACKTFSVEQEEGIHLLIGIETDGQWDRIGGGAVYAAEQTAVKGMSVDFLRIENRESELSRFMLDETVAFYRRP